MRIIAALDAKGGIGKNGYIPWYIPDDLKRFKELTLNSTVIMGRRTWESLPIKPLSGRKNVILTKNWRNYTSTENSLFVENYFESDAWVIGGTEVYKHYLPLCTKLYLTILDKDFNCDTFFPEFTDKFRLETQSFVEKYNEIRYRYEVWTKR